MVKPVRFSLLNRCRALLIVLCITSPSLAFSTAYFGMGTGLNTIVGDNNTSLQIDLWSGGSDPDFFDVKNHELAHVQLPELYLLAGIGKAFHHGGYSGIEIFLKYKPNKTIGDLSLLETGSNMINYKIDNTVALETSGITYGLNWIQSIFFSKAFFIYGLLGAEHTDFKLDTSTDYAASRADFGNSDLRTTFRRYGLNVGLGITRALSHALSLRAEYVYTRYGNLKHSGEGVITGSQPGDILLATSTVNPTNVAIRLIVTYRY